MSPNLSPFKGGLGRRSAVALQRPLQPHQPALPGMQLWQFAHDWPGIKLVPILSTEDGPDSDLGEEQRVASPGSDPEDVSDLVAAQKKALWLLLATQGTGFETEQPRDASSRPWPTFLGYELVRRTSPGKAAPAWTWRRPKSEMTEHYTVLAQLLNQGRYDAVYELLQRLARQPGFGGVREQSKELARFAQQRGYSGEVPPFFYL